MDVNLTIIIFLIGIVVFWTFFTSLASPISLASPTTSTSPTSPTELTKINSDDLLVQNYHKKSNYKKKVVLIIESFTNLEHLLTLLKNILKQDIKVNSIVLISSDETLNKVQLIQDTCIFNKIGGLSFLLKESSNDTILLFIFSDGFSAFLDPQFLKKFLDTNYNSRGLVKVQTNDVSVDINKLYY